MSLLGLQRSLYVLAAMVFCTVAGLWVTFGKELVLGFFPEALATFLFFYFLAITVSRVEDRISELEKKLAARPN